MRAITVRQPNAWAIVWDLKDVENRTRNIAGTYRGPVAIHAGLHPYEQHTMASRAHRATQGTEIPTDLVFGAIIGIADLTDVHDDGECFDLSIRMLANLYRSDPDAFREFPDSGAGGVIGRARMCSPWAMGDHHHLVLNNRRPLAKPIPYKGQLGLWTLSDEVLAGAL